jgi:hypothetical protein
LISTNTRGAFVKVIRARSVAVTHSAVHNSLRMEL